MFDSPANGKPQGVGAPLPLILPDPNTRFARTAARLHYVSKAHPMAEWLAFMARVAEAQHCAASTLARRPISLSQARVEHAVAKGLPPLAIVEEGRDVSWHDGLHVLLDSGDDQATPALARAAIERLRGFEPKQIEAVADDFLYGSVDGGDTGIGFYVAAALQVHFTRQAAALPATSLRLRPERGTCPCCGSPPVSGLVTDKGEAPGVRYLYCSLCGTAWTHVRAMCITCGQSRSVVLRAMGGESDPVKAETCDECRTYAKMLYRSHDAALDPFADDLATLALDIAVGDAGWSRHAPNPLVLVGSREKTGAARGLDATSGAPATAAVGW
jgi:FdhE protein